MSPRGYSCDWLYVELYSLVRTPVLYIGSDVRLQILQESNSTRAKSETAAKLERGESASCEGRVFKSPFTACGL